MESPAVEKNQWSSLFKVAGFAAILVIAFISIQMAVFMVNPPPATVKGWFSLFQSNALTRLVDMDLRL